jgi:alkanesulfonate monooxygenase SsuD/methylene tetrahydromethanopterin reductase-like flavin-dependent oxidoreductase (luciferase family)
MRITRRFSFTMPASAAHRQSRSEKETLRRKENGMHVGYAPVFQNPGNALSDAQVYHHELRLAEMAEPLGFDSIWSVEHHFTDYTMVPDVIQFLSYMAGKTQHVQLGSMVVVLPWHDPIRVAEQISMLDHLSGGRMLLGLGRGLARVEYDGFRVDQNEGRQRFLEYAELVLNALEHGYMEGGATVKQPRRDIRPYPLRSFRGRTYAAAVSPESMPMMARLGVGLLVIPQKPWDIVKQDFDVYHKVYREVNGTEASPPLCGGFFFVDEDAARAEEMAYKYIGGYYHTVLKHYEMTAEHFGTHKGYEFYRNVTKYIGRHGVDKAVADFASLMPWGTPAQLLEKLAYIRSVINMNGIMCHFSYAGMPYDEAERNLRCFVKHVLPELKTWETPPLPEPAPLTMPAPVL